MPNIELHGFKRNIAKNLKTFIFTLIEREAPTVNIDDVVVTIVPSIVQNKSGKSRPFVRVAITEKKDKIRVAKLINECVGLDVEWLYLDGFFEGKH